MEYTFILYIFGIVDVDIFYYIVGQSLLDLTFPKIICNIFWDGGSRVPLVCKVIVIMRLRHYRELHIICCLISGQSCVLPPIGLLGFTSFKKKVWLTKHEIHVAKVISIIPI
jgi:hypothetical protein